MLSKYCKKIADKYGIKVDGVKKLIPNLCKKIEYVHHYRNLQLNLSLGMKLTKIKQSDWMKKYIDFKTGKRKSATSNFQKKKKKIKINDQFCLWKNNRKFTKKNQCKIGK